MTRLIGDLVDAASLEAGHVALHLEPLDLASFLFGWKERLAGALPMDRVRILAGADVPAILADPARLDQILANLASNALKYSLPGSEVRVELSATEDALRLSVADRGPGIPPDELPRLFRRYYRARAAGRAEGLGLGLFITRKLVEAHGWRIEATSEVGTGTVFTVVIPAGDRRPHATFPAAGGGAATAG
jgi:signal transduction histidine kinase